MFLIVEKTSHKTMDENRDVRVDLEMIRVPIRNHMQETCSNLSRDNTTMQTMSHRREQGQAKIKPRVQRRDQGQLLLQYCHRDMTI